MPFSGGTYSLPAGNPVVSGTTISSTVQNNTMTDIATALSTTLCKDGQSTPTGNLPMGGFKLTGLGPGAASGDSLRWQQLFSQGTEADIASASVVDIGGQNTNFLRVTGTTTIASLGTNYNGPRFLRFAGAVTLTNNSSTLILPGAASITTAAGDTCVFVPKATSGTADGWVMVGYQHAPPPAFSVYQSAGQSIPTGVTTKLQFQSKEFDTGSFFDNTTNYRFQPTVSGYYEMQATASCAGMGSVSLYKNGAEYRRGVQFASNTSGVAAGVSGLVFLNGSTDYVEVWALQFSGSSQTTNVSPSTHFSGYLARFS